MVAKLFAPSVRCPKCSHANDFDLRFCQQCSYNRKIINSCNRTPPGVVVNAIDGRLQQLALIDQATSYSKQNDSIQKELENFLSSFPGYLTIVTVTPRDICFFGT